MKSLIKKIISRIRKKRFKKAILNSKHDSLEFRSCPKDYRKKGFSMSESYIYHLGENDFRNYINTWESYLPRLSNNSKYIVLSDDKNLFSMTFGKYIKTPKVVCTIYDGFVISKEALITSIESLYDYLKNNGGVMKDLYGSDGFDVYVFDNIDNHIYYKGKEVCLEDFKKIISKTKNLVVQEKLVQGEYANSLFDKSINTIRVISIKNKESFEHKIVAAAQRIGTKISEPVDNFNQGGLSSIIDINTGTLSAATSINSIDDAGKQIFYEFHPDTGARIKGRKVPNWNMISECVSNITYNLPYFNFIAWDFVVQEDGFALIEINMKSSLNLFQVHKGMRNDLIGEAYRNAGFLDKNY